MPGTESWNAYATSVGACSMDGKPELGSESSSRIKVKPRGHGRRSGNELDWAARWRIGVDGRFDDGKTKKEHVDAGCPRAVMISQSSVEWTATTVR